MNTLRRISSFAFVFLVLFASTNFMVGIHICGGEVQDIALFGKAQGCAQEDKMPPSCCDNETVVHQAEAFKGDVTQISLPETISVQVALPPVLVTEVLPETVSEVYRYSHYEPPLRTCDLNVAFHVFLI